MEINQTSVAFANTSLFAPQQNQQQQQQVQEERNQDQIATGNAAAGDRTDVAALQTAQAPGQADEQEQGFAAGPAAEASEGENTFTGTQRGQAVDITV